MSHGCGLVQLKNGFGLEGVLEALNNLRRKMRAHCARNDNTENNFKDTDNKLWDHSRPKIVEMDRVIKKRKPQILISTEIEALVESLFLEE